MKKKAYEWTNEELVAIARMATDFSSPCFSLYTNDFLGSTRVMAMRPEQVGAYCLLLMLAWNEKDCGLPNDTDLLPILSRLHDRWEKDSPLILGHWFEMDGRLYNRRLLQERRKQIMARQQRTEASARAVEVRKEEQKERIKSKRKKPKDLPTAPLDEHPEAPRNESDTEPTVDYELATATIYQSWQDHPGTVTHQGLTPDMAKNIRHWLKEYTPERLLDAIKLYGDVVLSPVHYWTHKFTIEDFFRRGSIQKPSPFKQFLPEAKPLDNYLKKGSGPQASQANLFELQEDDFYDRK